MIDHALDPQRNVIVAVFSAPPTVGWVLYFSGFKRASIIRKWHQQSASSRELGDEAMRHLIRELRCDGEPVGLRIIDALTGSTIEGLPSHLLSGFVLRDKPVRGEDADVLEYLFSQTPMSSQRRSMPLTPLPMSGPVLVPVSDEIIVIAADASFKSALDHGMNHAGTGWVIEFHDESGTPVIEVGNKNYIEHEEGHNFDANTFEMYAVRDALLHLSSMKESQSLSASRAVLYSDSTFVVRALMDRKSQVPMETTVDQIHDLIEALGDNGVEVEYMWTKGHADNKWNQMAHEMAGFGRSALAEASQN
jgi:ribonuclease HI